jgi:hypothetical protein
MNDDDELLTAVREQRTKVPMTVPVDQIISRGRAVRARRRITVAVGGLAAVTAAAVVLGLGLSGALGSAPARGTGTIRTAAFTLTRNANGTDTLTINPQVLIDPSTLQNDLAQDGIPAMVDTGRFCSSNPAPPAPAGFSQVVTFAPSRSPGVTINPSAIPGGTELSFGIFQDPTTPPTGTGVVALIDPNSYTCTSTAPTAEPSGGGLLIMFGGPAGS